jgi:class 3 adenylate cyclase
VNLASRLADHAAPGQILITERTMAEVADLVEGSVVEEVSLKGVSRPVRVYEIRPRAR